MRNLFGNKPAPAAPVEPPPEPPFSRQLLHETREEIDRADRKAEILLASTVVAVSAIVAGIIAGDWSPLTMPQAPFITWGLGALLVAIGIVLLATSIFPRITHHDPKGKVAYFGHVASYPSAEALRLALEDSARSADDRTVDQLWTVSRIVVRKYRLIRWALVLIGLGFVIGVAASVWAHLLGA